MHKQSQSQGSIADQKVGKIPPLTTGVFSKRGHFRKNWKSRFFVLELGRLSYYEKENKELTSDTPARSGCNFLKSLVLRNVGLAHHDDPCMLVLVDSLSNSDLFMKAGSLEIAELWRKRLAEHTIYAISYPNASLQLDHEEDDFRRMIAEALVSSEVLTTNEDSDEEEKGVDFMKDSRLIQKSGGADCKKEDEGEEGVGDIFVFKSHKGAAAVLPPKPPASRRPSVVRQISESVLDLDFKFENQEQDFCLDDQEGGGGDQGSEEGSSNGATEKGGKWGGEMSSGLAQRVQDSGLGAIGKQLKLLEKESKSTQEKALKDWQKEVAPKLKDSIKDLEKRIEGLRKEQKVSLKNKTGFQSDLDEAVRALLAEQDALKLQLYFPSEPPVSFGSGGVYFAMDYIWLENLAGKFHLKLSSSSYGSQISFKLLGAGSSSGEGVQADITIGGFKLKSENKRIPSLSLEQLNVRVCLRVELLLSFFAAKQQWTATPDHFLVQLLSFKGPFGITRSMVAALLSIAVPVLKRQVLAMLPLELGIFLSDVMVPLDVEGTFQVEGNVAVRELFHGMQKSPGICQTLGYHPEQMLNFLGLQKSLDRTGKSVIKSLIDLLRYRNDHRKQVQWPGIIRLWDQAAILYYNIRNKNSDMLRESEMRLTCMTFDEDLDEDVGFASSAFLSFEKLLQGAVQVEKNPLSVRFSLDTFRLDVTLCQMLRHAGEYYSRVAEELVEQEAKGGVVTKASKLYVQKMQALCHDSQQHIAALRQVIHNLQFLLRMHITSGPEGEVSWVAKDVYTQFPISFTLHLSPDEDSIFSPLVPTIKNVRTKEDGFVSYKLFHLGSPEMLKKAQFLAFKNKPRLDAMLNNDNHQPFDDTMSGDMLPKISEQPPPPLDVHAAQRKAVEAYALLCDKERLETKKLLSTRPEKMSSVKIFTLNVIRPRMAFIINDMVTLQPGAALFIVQVGADLDKEGKEAQQRRYEDEQELVRRSRRRKSTMLGDDALPHVEAISLSAFTQYDDDDEEGGWGGQNEQQQQEQGAPISAQGTHGLRTEAHMPEMQFQGKIPKLLQFISHHFDDLELLSDFYDETVEDSKKRADFMNLVLGIISKYLLTPHFELLLNLGALVSSHPDDVSVIFSTNKRYSPALNLFMRVDVLELLDDWATLMKAVVGS